MFLIFLLPALFLSSVSAYFSIIGMTSIFPSVFYPIIIMCIAFELCKLSSVLFLHKYWKSPKLIKTYLIISIFLLMLINSMGIFGYLSSAHINQTIINQSQTSQIELVQSKLENEQSELKDVNNQLEQIDNAINKLTDQGKAQTSLTQANGQRKQRDKLQTEKLQHIKAIEDLTREKINEDNNNAKITANFGPLVYIADALYGGSSKQQLESTVRYIITILVFVFDPLALVLLVASQYAFQNRKKLTSMEEDNIMMMDNNLLNENKS